MTTVKLGAPALTGRDCNDIVAEAFGEAQSPLTVYVKHHMPRDVVFPEVPGLFLRHVANPELSQGQFVIESHDLFQRLASSVEQVAGLNGYALALEISDAPLAAAEPTKPAKSKAGKKSDEADKADDTGKTDDTSAAGEETKA